MEWVESIWNFLPSSSEAAETATNVQINPTQYPYKIFYKCRSKREQINPTSIQDFWQSAEINASTLASESKLKIPASDDSCLFVPVTCSISDPLWMFAAFKSEHIDEEIGVWLSPITNLEDIKLSKVRIHWWGSHCLAIAHYNLRMDISSPAVIDGLRTHWRSQTKKRQKWPRTISGQPLYSLSAQSAALRV